MGAGDIAQVCEGGMNINIPICDICGKPATHYEHDMKEITKDSDTTRCYALIGKGRFGCDEHPPKKAKIYKNARVA